MSHASHTVTGPQHWFWARKARREAIHSPLDGGPLAQAIVDTVREPLLVLDKDLRVVAERREERQVEVPSYVSIKRPSCP